MQAQVQENQEQLDFLKSQVIEKISRVTENEGGDTVEVLFHLSDGRIMRMFHSYDCCETVYLADVIGDLNDLLGSPVFMAEVAMQEGDSDESDSSTWTFYKFATSKGYVTLRWLGLSNGFYGETVEVSWIDT